MKDGLQKEIYIDLDLKHYPLRDYTNILEELDQVIRSYDKVGSRNSKAIEHGKICKHSMHLVRLYLMALDILEKGEIITYRENDLPLLMDIRNGKYLKDGQMTSEFFEIVNELDKKFNYAKENTVLPEKPNYKKINEFVVDVNERIVKDEIRDIISYDSYHSLEIEDSLEL